MKKLLSFIGALSITSLTASSLVSCIISVPQKPKFDSLLSLTTSMWNETVREFANGEIVEDNSVQPITTTSFLFYTIASFFNNPEDVKTYFEANNVVYRAALIENNPTNSEMSAYMQIYLSQRPTITAKQLAIMVNNNKMRLPVNTEGGITVDLKPNAAGPGSNGANYVYQALIDFFNFYRNTRNSGFPAKLRNDQMYELDTIVKNQAINFLMSKKLPGYDETNQKLFSTIGEQLFYLNDHYIAMNNDILASFDRIITANPGQDIHKADLAKEIRELILGNLVIQLG